MDVPLRDMESENLLDSLEFCLDFIDESRKKVRFWFIALLVCPEDALESLQQSNELVSPNDAFIEQLTMFEDMGFKVDHSSIIYKRSSLKLVDASTLKKEVAGLDGCKGTYRF